MIVILPPSETKSPAGSQPPLSVDALSFPELNPVRERLISVLAGLSMEEGRAALGLTERQAQDLHHNRVLREAPTCSAIDRYTGVLYDALGAPSLTTHARSRLYVCSALFGLVRAEDRIPRYRLSGGSQLPGVGNIRTVWRPTLSRVASSLGGAIVDLRSGAYAALAPLPSAIMVRVITTEGKIVSHHNKATKGRLARVLVSNPVQSTAELVEIAQLNGLKATQTGQLTVDVVFG